MGAEKHPKGLYVLFFTEMWERFSFYLMLGILFQYLSDSLARAAWGVTDEEAAVVVGNYTALVYFTPFIGGLIADRLLGCRKTILIGATLMMIGHLVLAWPTRNWACYLGLGFADPRERGLQAEHIHAARQPVSRRAALSRTRATTFSTWASTSVPSSATSSRRSSATTSTLTRWRVTPSWSIGGWHAAFATAADWHVHRARYLLAQLPPLRQGR